MFGGIIYPIAALIKLIASIFGYDIPIALFKTGSFHIPLLLGVALAIIVGIILIIAGNYLLKLCRAYINWIVNLKQTN